ncbi:hypothetical protein GSI_01417 [Ganoderma sinense ZZ0214-1]|uniref:Uncharacterized protein n=1 Tax=Ganoderma sinense ZZ0214-1 TaxID=1077348 RepID=A0A2G8SVJ0_9APHY|nr:hypothetical protein GSI_01417 [Ganoderma sinense ZZ0214-1]
MMCNPCIVKLTNILVKVCVSGCPISPPRNHFIRPRYRAICLFEPCNSPMGTPSRIQSTVTPAVNMDSCGPHLIVGGSTMTRVSTTSIPISSSSSFTQGQRLAAVRFF